MSWLVRVTLASLTGIPADDVTNSFVFADGNAVPDDEYAIALVNFYNETYEAGIDGICSRLSPRLSRAADASLMSFYDITGKLLQHPPDGDHPNPWMTPLGAPIVEVPWTLGPAQAGAVMLAEELACCMSFRGAYAPGEAEELPGGPPGPVGNTRPRARRRGRVYIGPLNNFALTADAATFRVKPNAGFIDAVGQAGDALKDHVATNPDTGFWSVWSRVAGALSSVDEVSVDDAVDVQRRRGSKPTLRTVFA